MINWEELEAIENGWKQIRSERFRGLSSTYIGGEGDNPEAFIVGTAPGAQETAKGRPFIDPPGLVLRQLMELAGLFTSLRPLQEPKPNCWLTNVVKFRPPKNRAPTEVEIKAAKPLLLREWLAVGKPRLIIPIGKTALQVLTNKRFLPMGKPHYYVSRSTDEDAPTLMIWPMIPPSYVLHRKERGLEKLVESHWERLGVWRNAH